MKARHKILQIAITMKPTRQNNTHEEKANRPKELRVHIAPVTAKPPILT
jgi:hypothetical protein